MLPIHEQWNKDGKNILVGRKIVDARYMTTEDANREGWGKHLCGSLVITLDDGTKIFPSTDDEGNGPGALFVVFPGQSERFTFPVCTVRGDIPYAINGIPMDDQEWTDEEITLGQPEELNEEAEAQAHEENLENVCIADNYAPEYE